MNRCPSRTCERHRRLDDFARLARRDCAGARHASRRAWAARRAARTDRPRIRVPAPRAARRAANRAAGASRAANRREARTDRSRRSGHGLDSHAIAPSPSTARSGSTKPAGVASPAGSSRARRARSSGWERSAFIGSTLTGSAASACSSFGTSSYAVISIDGRQAERAARRSPNACAVGERRGARLRRVRDELVVVATAARRRCARRRRAPSAAAARPGYHLPWPIMQEAVGGEARLQALAGGFSPSSRFFGDIAV